MAITRSVFSSLRNELEKPEVLILIGARQVGKTHLLNELEAIVKQQNKAYKYFNLELPQDSRFFNNDIVELFQQLTENVDYLFIDEFQYFENASKFFKAIFDDRKSKTKVIASGSSSLEIHKHLKESLAGRKKEKTIYPLSFLEFQQTNNDLTEYLIFGAMPGLIKLEKRQEKIELLNNLLQTYILRDIKALIREENVPAFNNLIYLLANYQGQMVPSNNLAKELKVDNKTIERYLYLLEQTFVIYHLHGFSANLSNEIKKSKKYYLYDLGIRNLLVNNFKDIDNRNDKGRIYETYVHNFLRTHSPINSELRFWRTRNGEEVDFVYIKDQDIFAFEVKSQLKSLEISPSLKKFLRAYPNTKKAFIVNENITGTNSYKNIEVEFIDIKTLEENESLRTILES